MKTIILAILTSLCFSGCTALKQENASIKLDGPSWQLTAIEHKAVVSNGRAYLKFDGEDLEVQGKAFCNSISADYERMGDNQITFQEITSTKMFCDGVMNLEEQMMSNLRKVKKFEIRNGRLYLSDSDNVLLTFKSN
ncbi:META domain-containing protein [Paradesertivirga mongoliensis]|uniref:META domain-containing protein n=1 Tax=Paradesertivirga mongoliensis TaxID=2100740 RepID=A0ABW4ZNZ8_9SPHI|nr:META domain-containing protein [Pedobacter mongoliensis]